MRHRLLESGAFCRAWGLALAAALLPRVALADVFGTEHVPLSALVANSIRQNMQLGVALGYLRETTQLARDSSMLAQESVMVGRNVAAIIQDPAGFLTYAARGWSAAFPELQDVLADSIQVRQSLEAALNPDSMPLYDPYAYVRAFDTLNALTNSGFSAWIHAVDTFGLSDVRDKQIQALREQHEMAVQNLAYVAHAVNSTGLSNAQAAASTTLATSVSATAQVAAAASLANLDELVSLSVASMTRSAARREAERLKIQEEATQIYAPSWRLRPLDPPPQKKGLR